MARRRSIPDLSGKTFGTWRVLYEAEVERKRGCMCQCLQCGVRKLIIVLKLWHGYALQCRECKVSRELVEVRAGEGAAGRASGQDRLTGYAECLAGDVEVLPQAR